MHKPHRTASATKENHTRCPVSVDVALACKNTTHLYSKTSRLGVIMRLACASNSQKIQNSETSKMHGIFMISSEGAAIPHDNFSLRRTLHPRITLCICSSLSCMSSQPTSGKPKLFSYTSNQTTQNQIFSARFLGSRTSYSASSASAISLPVHTSTS